MFVRRMRTTGALLLCSAVLMCGGLASTALGASPCGDPPCVKAKKCGFCNWLKGKCDTHACATHKQVTKCGLCEKLARKCDQHAPTTCPPQTGMTSDLPLNAEAGECYAKAIVQAEYKTVTERHLVQEASERIEIVPAQFKWVEQQITIKEPSTQLEVVPAEYKWQEKTIEVKPARTGWVMQNAADCVLPDKNSLSGGVLCLRTTPAVYKTVRTQCLVRPACVRQIAIPGEYQTIRRQVVASPATTRKVCIAAVYENIEKTVLVCPERVKWEHIVCEDKLTSDTVNKVKSALLVSGFNPGPLNGKFTPEDRVALVAFQQKRGLGAGQLSYETLKQLGVSGQ